MTSGLAAFERQQGQGWTIGPDDGGILGVLNEGLLGAAGVTGDGGLGSHHTLEHHGAGRQGDRELPLGPVAQAWLRASLRITSTLVVKRSVVR